MKIARAALHHKQRRAFLSSLLACSGIALHCSAGDLLQALPGRDIRQPGIRVMT